MSDPSAQITSLLNQVHEGREGALDQVMELVYSDLRRVAGRQLQKRYGSAAAAKTLQPTALVNEAFLKLIKQRRRYDSRGHFFAIATRLMLRVLMDYDKARRRRKRGGDQVRVSLSGVARTLGQEPTADIPAFVEALGKLERLDERNAEVVKLRLMWGLTVPEIAETMGLSVSTVEREWRFARRWIAAELAPES